MDMLRGVFSVRCLIDRGTFGAEITGIDLGGVLDQRVVAKLKQAFLEYKVLVFHDQASSTPARP